MAAGPARQPEGLAGHARDGRDRGRGGGPDGSPPRRGHPLRRRPTPYDRPRRTAHPVPGLHVGAVEPGHRGALWAAPEDILRFDLNTSPLRRPTSADGAGRAVRPAAQRVPRQPATPTSPQAAPAYVGVDRRECSWVRARTRCWTSSPRHSCRPAAAAIVPIPTYAMYGVLTTQRGGDDRRVCRGLAADGASPSTWTRSCRGCRRRCGLAVRPQQPDRRARSRSRPSSQILDAAAALGPAHRWSWSTRPTPSSPARRRCRCVDRYPNLVVVRTMSKAFALAGMRVGYAVAAAADHRAAGAHPAAGQRLDGVGGGRRAGAASRPTLAQAERADGLGPEREWLAGVAGRVGLAALSQRHQLRAGAHRDQRGGRGRRRRGCSAPASCPARSGPRIRCGATSGSRSVPAPRTSACSTCPDVAGREAT